MSSLSQASAGTGTSAYACCYMKLIGKGRKHHRDDVLPGGGARREPQGTYSHLDLKKKKKILLS